MKIFREQTLFSLPNGRTFPIKTIFLTEEKEVKCFCCGNRINDRDIVYFCKLLNKFSCWDCNQKECLPCHKFLSHFQSHIDLLGELHIVEKVVDVL